MKTKSLSLYRTENIFNHYAEVTKAEEVIDVMSKAREENRRIYFLGNGSNTLFIKKHVNSYVVKNKLTRSIKDLGNDRFYVSSSTLVSKVLKHCLSENRDCFYYLASVPAEIGGALAMNAGQGKAMGAASIMDFVESVHYIKDGVEMVEAPSQLGVSYRNTIFTGQTEMFILGATFKFSVCKLSEENPIKSRIEWAKNSQDLAKPNCGSVFKVFDGRIVSRLKGLSLFGASFSRKTNNWIINTSPHPRGIRALIFLVFFLHRCLRLKCETEVIRVK